MRYTVRPISDRSGFTGEHEPTPFRAKWSATLDLLDVELQQLGASDVVLEVDCAERDVRLDGMLRANAKVSSPAVRLAFDSIHGPLVYATDRYVGRYYNAPADWQENVRAIALSLESLRRVDRYGVTKRGEQYTGWKQLGAGTGATPVGAVARMSEDHARRVITDIVGPVDRPWDTRFRVARGEAHPDRHGGDRTLWDQVEEAGKVLGLLR